MRKFIYLLLLILVSFSSMATTYYVSATGSDSNNGTSSVTPWQTLGKVSGITTFAANDLILFKRGDTFVGTLVLPKSSTSGNPITFGAYGTGAKPIITSMETLSGWVLHSAGIYKVVGANIPTNCNIVTIDGVNTEIGKYPSSGFNTWESYTYTSKAISKVENYTTTVAGTIKMTSTGHGLTTGTMIVIQNTTSYNGYYSVTVIDANSFYITKTFVSDQTGTVIYNTTITDNQLTNTPNFVGAELVQFKSNWTIDRNVISQHTNGLLRYITASPWPVQSSGGNQYSIQKSINCLLTMGDWYTDGTDFYMYFGGNTPSSYVVKAGKYSYTIQLDRKNYNTLEDLEINGGNDYAINCISSIGFNVKNCTIKNNGLIGLNVITNAVTGASSATLVDSCAFSHVNGTGIWLNSAGSTIKNSTFDHIGDFAGMAAIGGGSHYAIYTKGIGNITEYNTITNTGYLPIYWESNNAEVRYNVVDTYPTLGLNDGGGIYTFSSQTNSGQKVHHNIIRNSTANGLYSDGGSNHIEFYNNIVYNIDKWGIHMNEPVGNNVHDNLFCDFGQAGIDITNQYYLGIAAATNTVQNNILVQGLSTQVLYRLADENTNNAVLNFGTSNYNTFIADLSANSVFNNQKGSSGSLPFSNLFYNFTNWKTLTGQEANSTLSLYDLSTVSVIYNDTNSAVTVPITDYKIDLQGVIYNSVEDITLQPFTWAVLFPYDAPPVINPTGTKWQYGPTKKVQIYNGKIQYN